MSGNDLLHELVQGEGKIRPPTKRSAGDYEEMREKLLENAYELKVISEREIPEAFPLTPPKGGIDSNYNHSDFEMMFIDSQTDIDDGTAAIGIIQRMLVKFDALKLILMSLFPTKTSNGVYELQITDQFQGAMQVADEGIGMFTHYLKTLNNGLGQYPKNSVNVSEMKKLKNHLIRLGVEFYKSGEIPFDLRGHGDGILSPEKIAQERETIQNAVTQIAAQNMVMLSPPNKGTDEKDEVKRAFSTINFASVFGRQSQRG